MAAVEDYVCDVITILPRLARAGLWPGTELSPCPSQHSCRVAPHPPGPLSPPQVLEAGPPSAPISPGQGDLISPVS